MGREGKTFIGQAVGNYYGWQVKRLMERTYVAMILPEWDPDTLKRPRPPIAELDAILNNVNEAGKKDIFVEPNGSINTHDEPVVTKQHQMLRNELDSISQQGALGRKCSKCGGAMAHYRLKGYQCVNLACPGPYGGGPA